MKKWIIGACSILLLLLISSYFFIPRKAIVTRSITANANQTGVFRFLTDESNWQKWWPDSSSVIVDQKTVFESGGYHFEKTKMLYNSFEITIEKDNRTCRSLLHIFSLGNDSIKIEWNTIVNTGRNPFSRIHRYFKAQEIGNSLDVILTAMQKHITNVKNLYGIEIRKEKVKIEFLVSTTKSFTHYPRTSDIYEMISKIKKHIGLEQAKEEGHPMLHIKAIDSTHFEAQVAIPVNKELANTDTFSSKKMLKFGNILVAEIIGGKSTADSAMKQIDLYVSDYQYSNIALPFQSLVTDRMKIADTSKWLTRIYYPIL